MSLDPHNRFSNRVANYLRYRPHYPAQIIDELEKSGVLTKDSIIADLGSGTGFLAELFLRYGCEVYGLEPNDAMREVGDEYLRQYDRFHSLKASAEESGLNDDSIDLITAGQAFHWFDIGKARIEIRRITLPPHWLAVVFNDRDLEATGFMREYDRVLRENAPDYQKIRGLYLSIEQFRQVFGHDKFKRLTFPYEQQLDEDGLVGRVLSSSYVPMEGEPGHDTLVKSLRQLFQKHSQSGYVTFVYRTTLVFGKVDGD